MLNEEQIREADHILRRRKCQREGHDYEVKVRGMYRNIPDAVICACCGEVWRIYHPVDPPTQVIHTIDAPTQIMPRQR